MIGARSSEFGLRLFYQEHNMVEMIKKAIFTGIGLAVLTKEKAEELVHEFTSQAKLSEQEGKELVESLLKQSEDARLEFKTKVEEAVQAAVSRLNLASKEEVNALKAQVEELSKKIHPESAG